MTTISGGSPSEDPPNPLDINGVPSLDGHSLARWAEHEVPSDRIKQALSRGYIDQCDLPIEQAVMKALRQEVIRRFRACNAQFDVQLEEQRELRFAALLIPETLPGRSGLVPNTIVEPRFTFPRGYSLCCEMRNREGRSLVYHSGGGFAFSRAVPGESEQPVALSLLTVRLQDAQRESFLANPSAFGLEQKTYMNRAAFYDQLSQIQSGSVLEYRTAMINPPMWSQVRAHLVELFRQRGSSVGLLRVNEVRPFPHPLSPGEFVCDTNFGAAWVQCRWNEYIKGGYSVDVHCSPEEDRIRGMGGQ